LSNFNSACPHPVQVCQTKFKLKAVEPHLCMPSLQPSSRLLNPAQSCQTLPLPLHAYTQFKDVEPHLCITTPSSRLWNPTSACPHPVQGCRTPLQHAHTQFKAVEPILCYPHQFQGSRTPLLHAHTQFKAVESLQCMPTPISRLQGYTPPPLHEVGGLQTCLVIRRDVAVAL
jgi:hypothetical protein